MACFQFEGLTLQHALRREEYYRIAKAWTEADPDHRLTTTPGFWFEHAPNIESYVLEDKFGIILFFRLERKEPGKIEVHIQFPPALVDPKRNAERRARVMRGLTKGLEWIERVLAAREENTLFFTSKSPRLIRFCKKRLGFKGNGERLEKRIQQIPSPVSSGN